MTGLKEKMPDKIDSDEVGTPRYIIWELEDHCNEYFTVDLAASHENHICNRYFTPEGYFMKGTKFKDKALDLVERNFSIMYNDFCFLNPPYSHSKQNNLSKWFRLACYLGPKSKGVVILVNSNITSTKAFHDFIGGSEYERKKNRIELYFFKKRITFKKNKKSGYPFASMAIIIK